MNNRFLICKIQSITIDTKDKTKNVIIFDICMKPMFSECQTKYKEMIDIVLNIMSISFLDICSDSLLKMTLISDRCIELALLSKTSYICCCSPY